MKITLISPTMYGRDERPIKTKRAFIPNLATAYLAALAPKHHEIRIVDDTVDEIDYKAPVDLVGITTMAITAERAYRIADIFRTRGAKVVLGGMHATAEPEEALEHADAVVIGEAEDSWPELLRDAENGRMKRTYQAPGRESLEGLPHPRFDLVDPRKYVRMPFRKSMIIPVSTSRGCPRQCNFCCVGQFWGNTIRFRPAEEVVEEIRASRADTVLFADDNLLFDEERAEELLRALIPLKIKFFCQADTRIHRYPDLIKLLREAGCFVTFIGMESLNTEALKSMHKGFNQPEEYRNLLKMLNDNGINVYASFVLGSDGDTAQTARDTAQFLIDNKASLASFFVLTPFPKTELYDTMKAADRMVDPKWWQRLTAFQALDLGMAKLRDGEPNPRELRAIATRQFYSWGSIAKRFATLDPNKLMCLPLNIATKRKMDKHNTFLF